MKALRHLGNLALWLLCCAIGAYTLYGFIDLGPDKPSNTTTTRQVVSHSHANP